jgi:hypothetical protein
MIVTLDVLGDSERDRERCPHFLVKNVPLTCLVLAVEQNVENVFLLGPLGVVLWIDTPYPVEIAVAKKGNQSIVLTT